MRSPVSVVHILQLLNYTLKKLVAAGAWRLNARRMTACIYWKFFYFLKKKVENVNNFTFIINWIQNSSRYTYNLIFRCKFCLCYTGILILTYFESCIITLCNTAKWVQNIYYSVAVVFHIYTGKLQETHSRDRLYSDYFIRQPKIIGDIVSS